MSKQPNEEEGREVTEAKSDSNDEAIKAAVAAILMAIVIICGLIGTWAAATSHYTTLIVVIIGGIVSVGLATWFGWPPKQIRRRTTDLLNKAAAYFLQGSQAPPSEDPSIPPDKPSQAEIIQAEYDRLAKEHVRVKLAHERLLNEKEQGRYETTKLQHNHSVDETEALTPLMLPKPVKSKGKLSPTLEAPQSDDLDEEKRRILSVLFKRSFVGDYELESRFNLQENVALYHLGELRRAGYLTVEHSIRLTVGTRYYISQKGREFVISHKLHLPQQQTSSVSQADDVEAPLHPSTSRVKDEILRTLAQHKGASDKRSLKAALHVFHYALQQPPLDDVTIDYHLHELEEQDYLSVTRNRRRGRPDKYSLTQTGRKYVIDHELNKSVVIPSTPSGLTADSEKKEESAARAERTIAQIAKQLEHRRIEAAPSDKALRVLQARPKGSVEMVYLANDHEAWVLAIDFVHLMNRAGWNVFDDSPKGLATILDLGAAPFGITIQARQIDGDSPTVRLYDSLVDAIAAAGFSSAGGADPQLPAGCCRIIVGPKETGRLEIDTATQRERTAKAEKALLELQGRTKQRHLTPEQRSQLITLLRRGPVSSISVEGINGDSEVSSFGHELGSALQEGGCNVIAFGTRTSAENFSGLKVLAVTIEDPAAIALHKSLNEIGLSASLELNPEHLVNPKMPKVPSWFFDESDPVDRLLKQMDAPCVLWVGLKP